MNLRKASRIALSALTPNKPHHAQWLITRKCNYRCRGCNVWKEQDQRELSTEEVKRGLDILRDLGIVELVISGGDPLLRKDISEIIDYASNLFVTTVYDNGSMAKKKLDPWEVEHAAGVLIEAERIKADKDMFPAAKKEVKRQAEAAQNAMDLVFGENKKK